MMMYEMIHTPVLLFGLIKQFVLHALINKQGIVSLASKLNTDNSIYPESKVYGAHLGSVGPRWAPCCPHEPLLSG